MRKWVLDWFNNKSGVDIENLMQNMDKNYLEMGYIDSFGFLQLLSECEQSHGIQFKDEDFELASFYTINGFLKVAEERKNE